MQRSDLRRPEPGARGPCGPSGGHLPRGLLRSVPPCLPILPLPFPPWEPVGLSRLVFGPPGTGTLRPYTPSFRHDPLSPSGLLPPASRSGTSSRGELRLVLRQGPDPFSRRTVRSPGSEDDGCRFEGRVRTGALFRIPLFREAHPLQDLDRGPGARPRGPSGPELPGAFGGGVRPPPVRPGAGPILRAWRGGRYRDALRSGACPLGLRPPADPRVSPDRGRQRLPGVDPPSPRPLLCRGVPRAGNGLDGGWPWWSSRRTESASR